MRSTTSCVARRLAFTVAGLFLAALAAAPAHAAWQFAVPDGWTDLSPGQPVPKEIPEALATMVHSGTYAAYAIDMKGSEDGFAENLNAVVNHRPLVADETTLKQYVGELPAQAAREVPGARVTVSEKSVQPIGGVPSLRVVADITAPGVTMRTLQYVIPGGEETVLLTYSATPETFDRYLPTFEAAAQKTQGAAAAPMAAQIGSKLLATGVSASDWKKIFGFGGKIIGAAFGVGLVLLVSRMAKRKKAAG